jgi:hypothetical protein
VEPEAEALRPSRRQPRRCRQVRSAAPRGDVAALGQRPGSRPHVPRRARAGPNARAGPLAGGRRRCARRAAGLAGQEPLCPAQRRGAPPTPPHWHLPPSLSWWEDRASPLYTVHRIKLNLCRSTLGACFTTRFQALNLPHGILPSSWWLITDPAMLRMPACGRCVRVGGTDSTWSVSGSGWAGRFRTDTET